MPTLQILWKKKPYCLLFERLVLGPLLWKKCLYCLWNEIKKCFFYLKNLTNKNCCANLDSELLLAFKCGNFWSSPNHRRSQPKVRFATNRVYYKLTQCLWKKETVRTITFWPLTMTVSNRFLTSRDLKVESYVRVLCNICTIFHFESRCAPHIFENISQPTVERMGHSGYRNFTLATLNTHALCAEMFDMCPRTRLQENRHFLNKILGSLSQLEHFDIKSSE